MRKLSVFNHITLDGYFVGANGDFSWAMAGNDDAEYQAFVSNNAGSDSEMLFGRVTYALMASYWPTAIADQHNPVVAKKMNNTPKIVFSKTLDKATWANTTHIKGDMIAEVKKMKEGTGPDMVIFGSGNVIAQLAAAKLIDEYQMVIDPVALGQGRSMFDGMDKVLNLKLTNTRIFKNGKILVNYLPEA